MPRRCCWPTSGARYCSDELIVVSPDVGGVVRARAVAKRLDDADLAIIDKRRPRANEATVMNIIGEVEGKICVLVDDIVDTAGTLCAAAAALKERGAKKVVAYCTHPVLSGEAVQNIEEFADGRAGGDRHHSAARGSAGVRQDPPAFRRRVAGGNDAPDGVRGVGQQLVRGLSKQEQERPRVFRSLGELRFTTRF